MSSKSTVREAGEQLFEELLTARGYKFERIEPSNEPTADYKIITNSGILICEAKDFGEDELAIAQHQEFEKGRPFVTNYSPDQRLTRRIKRALRQLNQYKDLAGAVVLFSQFGIPYDADTVCMNHLPAIFAEYPLISGVIVTEKIRTQIAKAPLLELSIRETAELWAKELLQPLQIQARIYKNSKALQQFPAELFCNSPDKIMVC